MFWFQVQLWPHSKTKSTSPGCRDQDRCHATSEANARWPPEGRWFILLPAGFVLCGAIVLQRHTQTAYGGHSGKVRGGQRQQNLRVQPADAAHLHRRRTQIRNDIDAGHVRCSS